VLLTWLAIGPGMYCSPRHRMSSNSRNERLNALDDVAGNICQALIPGAAAAVARLKRAGATICVVTNQTCVGKGLLTEDGLAGGLLRTTSRPTLARHLNRNQDVGLM